MNDLYAVCQESKVTSQELHVVSETTVLKNVVRCNRDTQELMHQRERWVLFGKNTYRTVTHWYRVPYKIVTIGTKKY